QEGAEFVADFCAEHPPTLFPGTHAARRPGFGVAFHRIVDAARHGTERVADQIVGALEDGEFGAVAEERVGHGNSVRVQSTEGRDPSCELRVASNESRVASSE